jgi:hypothetical protein
MASVVDSKGNSLTIESAPLPHELLIAYDYGINKLFDFLEECERQHQQQTAIPVDMIADSRICAIQKEAVALSAGEI